MAPPENVVNLLGYRLLREDRVDDALEALRYNTQAHPTSANARDSLGEALEVAGDLESAREHYREAIALGEPAADPNLAAYRQHLADVEETLAVP